VARRGELARRVAALERAKTKAAPGVGFWPPWDELLSDEERLFVRRLVRRPWPPPGEAGEGPRPDWRDEYRAMCRDEAERAMLGAILAKEETPGTDSRAARPGRCWWSLSFREWVTLFPDEEPGDTGGEPAVVG
jgi:hypothetical protein